jgi:glycosyltransferase involved in cell wall biosynthesis
MITLCICTYNRASSLRRTLSSLRQMKDLEALYEIIVIDNNSTDSTPLIVNEFKSTLPIRRVLESSQGLSHARNRAIREFRSDTLLFTDDDVLLDRNWVSEYASAISGSPEEKFFGGRILPYWGDHTPAWFKGEKLALIDGLLVWYDYGTANRRYALADDPPYGASFAIRRSLLNKMGPFRVDLGCRGHSRLRGEETEFLQRCIDAGASGMYVGKALCWHSVDMKRLKLTAIFRHGIAKGKSHKAMAPASTGSLLRVPIHLGRGLNQLIRGRGDRFRQCVINAGIEIGIRSPL